MIRKDKGLTIKERMRADMRIWEKFLAFQGERPILAAIRSAENLDDLNTVCVDLLPNVIRTGRPTYPRSKIPQRNGFEESYLSMRHEVLHKLDDCVFSAYRYKIMTTKWRTDPPQWKMWMVKGLGPYLSFHETSFNEATLERLAPRWRGQQRRFIEASEIGRKLPRNCIPCGTYEVHIPLYGVDCLSWMPLRTAEVIYNKTRLTFYENSPIVTYLALNQPLHQGHPWVPVFDSFRDYLAGYEDCWFRVSSEHAETAQLLERIEVPEELDIFKAHLPE